MLCLSCDRQSTCLARQLAEANPKVQRLLAQLKVCEMRIASNVPATPLAVAPRS